MPDTPPPPPGIDEKIAEAVANEDYELAARLKKMKTSPPYSKKLVNRRRSRELLCILISKGRTSEHIRICSRQANHASQVWYS